MKREDQIKIAPACTGDVWNCLDRWWVGSTMPKWQNSSQWILVLDPELVVVLSLISGVDLRKQHVSWGKLRQTKGFRGETSWSFFLQTHSEGTCYLRRGAATSAADGCGETALFEAAQTLGFSMENHGNSAKNLDRARWLSPFITPITRVYGRYNCSITTTQETQWYPACFDVL